jgi:phospholipase C
MNVLTTIAIAALAAVGATTTPSLTPTEKVNNLKDHLKSYIHTLSKAEADAALHKLKADIHGLEGYPTPPPHQNKIDHFVVLFMENHAFDHLLGCQDVPGIDGIAAGHSVPVDPLDPSKGLINITCGKAPYICPSGPGYDTFSGKFPARGGNPNFYPYSPQSDLNSGAHGAAGVASEAFSPAQVPIKSAFVKHFTTMNNMYTAVPSASTPNHLFAQSATSCGIHDNILYSQCGGKTDTFPQFTIYDALAVENVTFAAYLNSTCGVDGIPCHGEDPHNEDSGSAISTPDVGMQGVGRWKTHFHSQEIFYERAANGTLPSFSWIHPPIQACDHPCHDIAKGERFQKDIYEALRAGPAWNKTLLLIAYDDAGGYYDHVVPPSEGVPNDDSPCHVVSDCGPNFRPFDFRRLGLRSTAMLISPWVAATVAKEPKKGPFNTSQFELTSIVSTTKNLFNLSGFLTKRDMWSGSLDELLLDAPRTDTPMHLPDAPAAALPWDPVPPIAGDDDDDNDDDKDAYMEHRDDIAGAERSGPIGGGRRTMEIKSNGGNENVPQHCSQKQRVCRGAEVVSVKQRRNMELFGSLLGLKSIPNPDEMTLAEADLWLRHRWGEYMAQ